MSLLLSCALAVVRCAMSGLLLPRKARNDAQTLTNLKDVKIIDGSKCLGTTRDPHRSLYAELGFRIGVSMHEVRAHKFATIRAAHGALFSIQFRCSAAHASGAGEGQKAQMQVALSHVLTMRREQDLEH
eukprot:4866853-Amphidinium_carterae.2